MLVLVFLFVGTARATAREDTGCYSHTTDLDGDHEAFVFAGDVRQKSQNQMPLPVALTLHTTTSTAKKTPKKTPTPTSTQTHSHIHHGNTYMAYGIWI